MTRLPRGLGMLALGLFASGAARAQAPEPEPEPPAAQASVAAPPTLETGAAAPADHGTASPNTPPVDQGVAPQKPAEAKREKKLRWRGTSFSWANRVTAQTLGIGNDYQSSNPYYEWFFSLRPRYYLWEEGDDTLSLRATLNAYVELTNSDTTTKEHEFLIDDSTLALVPSFTLAKDGDYRTVLTLAAPRYVIPTSKASRSAGIYGELGARAGITQTLPIRSDENVLPTADIGARAGYGYLFSSGNVPEDADLDQLRMNVGGVTVPSDQLNGAALAQHRASAHIFGSLEIYRDVLSLSTEVGMDWFWKFPLAETDVTTGTGEAEVPSQDSGRLQRMVFFDAELSAEAIRDILTVAVGYESFPTQLGAGGKRQSLFYNTNALFTLSLELSLDGLYLKASGQKAPSEEVASVR
ncbi:MAG TPA: hypothetical protein VMS65_09670 [Polyangiaceae bacterium]|nr:hypothetical protein [Polyangiaceae bacterium]